MAVGRLRHVLAASNTPRLWTRHEGHHDDEEEDENDEAHQDAARHHALSELFWYILIAVLLIGLVLRLARAWVARQRWSLEDILSRLSLSSWTRRGPAWLSSTPLAKPITISIYSAFLAFLLTWKAIKHDEEYYERLGYRAAWISTTQSTLVFLLAARLNPIGLVLGVSYERLNWLHRWASRIFFATVTIHGSFFLAEWLPASFFWEELRTVAVVKWGIAAWFVLLWMVTSSLLPARRWNYEFFVFQHVASAVVLLGLLFLHVPAHHHFSVWCAAVAFAYDVVTRWLNISLRNIRLRMPASAALGKIPRYAHSASLEAVDSELTIVTIKDVTFRWTPGQHVLIWTPNFRQQSPHPFTIASAADMTQSSQDIQLMLKSKAGYTRTLNQWASRRDEMGQDTTLRLLLAGPFGSSPNWRQYQRLVLVSASTGGSFTTPILEDILSSQDPGCLQRVVALSVVRRKAHATPYCRRISRLVSGAKKLGISIHVEVAVTGGMSAAVANARRGSLERLTEADPFIVGDEDGNELDEVQRASLESSHTSSTAVSENHLNEDLNLPLTDDGLVTEEVVRESSGRPDIARFIAREVGEQANSAMVAVCAGDKIEDLVRRSVASIRSSLSPSISQHIDLHFERSDI